MKNVIEIKLNLKLNNKPAKSVAINVCHSLEPFEVRLKIQLIPLKIAVKLPKNSPKYIFLLSLNLLNMSVLGDFINNSEFAKVDSRTCADHPIRKLRAI
jgi:hypothetical protein